MSNRRLMVIPTTILVIMLPPSLARSQQAQENAPGFIERWIIPGAQAVEPPAPPDAQRLPQDQARQPERAAVGTRTTKQRKKAAAGGVVGKASFYSYTRGKTASGTAHNPNALTAAHRTLPFGTRLRVTDIKTRKSVDVVVNDRGPAIRDRAIDLSRGAAQVLGMTSRGVAQVRIQVVTRTN
jgi:rare lipoprotein A (peptidoglycan hydrolase)